MSLRAIDFARQRERTPPLGIALLVLGVLCLLAVVLCQQRWSSARERSMQEAERRAEALRVQRQARQMVVVPTADDKRLQRVAAERSRPWMAALRAVESATRDPVFLLTMSSDVSSQSFRLEAEAPSFEHALAYVQVLPDGQGLSSAQLLSHEVVIDAASGRPVVRFSVSARWRMP